MHISQNKDGSHSVPASYRETEQAAENTCLVLRHSEDEINKKANLDKVKRNILPLTGKHRLIFHQYLVAARHGFTIQHPVHMRRYDRRRYCAGH